MSAGRTVNSDRIPSSRRIRARIVAWIALLFLTAFVAASLLPSSGSIAAEPVASAMGLTFFPMITIKPIPITLFPFDRLKIVNIPDDNLNAFLHAECSVPLSDPILRGHLYDLTGYLEPISREIVNLEGIQFCKQIHTLNLSYNPVEEFPDMSGMLGLQMLHMNDCGLDEVPEAVRDIPNLGVLEMNNNELTELPLFLADLPLLSVLYVQNNKIKEIPNAFGSSGIFTLSMRYNRLTELPESLVGSPALSNLLVTGNRLTDVPQSFGDREWEVMDFEFNFLDVSSGSEDGMLLSSLITSECHYERQLTPIRDLTAETTPTTIRLTWTACPDTDTGAYSTKVQKYYVYENIDGALHELAVLGKDVTEFTEENLTPLTERTYSVGVEYKVDDSMYPGITRHFTTITAVTTEVSATPAPTVLTPGASPEASPSATPTDAPGEGGTSRLPVWVLAVGGGLGVVLLGGVVALVIVLFKKP